MKQPKRIQRQRTKGWRMPEGAVYVGRPTKWGNPFHQSWHGRSVQVRAYRDWLRSNDSAHGLPPQPQEIAQLRGKDLACWCPLDQQCHADVLLEIANSNRTGSTTGSTEGDPADGGL